MTRMPWMFWSTRPAIVPVTVHIIKINFSKLNSLTKLTEYKLKLIKSTKSKLYLIGQWIWKHRLEWLGSLSAGRHAVLCIILYSTVKGLDSKFRVNDRRQPKDYLCIKKNKFCSLIGFKTKFLIYNKLIKLNLSIK